MKVAYFDCQFGAAGDMLLGALIDAGLPVEIWQSELKKLALPEGSFSVQIENVLRCSIASKKVHVLAGEGLSYDEATLEHRGHIGREEHGVHQSPGHHHQKNVSSDKQRIAGQANRFESGKSIVKQDRAPKSDDKQEHNHEPERRLDEILQIIENSKIADSAKSLAAAIFRNLAIAEGSVHGMDPEKVHFHEVGAIDSIVDIIGFAIGYDLLKIEHSTVSPLPLGSGTVKTAHGLLPVPGPAVTYLLSAAKAPIQASDFKYECLTPTGAAILTTIASGWGGAPSMENLTGIGYGAGAFDPSQFPNVCRVIVGEGSAKSLVNSHESTLSRFDSESIIVIEANFDDFTPQALAFTSEQLFKLGALDVFITPCLMKKGRSGHQLTALCYPSTCIKLEEHILSETTTLGVRKYLSERTVLRRKWQEVTLTNGRSIRVKVAYDNAGNAVHSQPEYEDCADYARSSGLPIQEVLNLVTGQLFQKCSVNRASS